MLLTEEWNRTGRSSIRDFYWRRIVRLGPAAVFFFAIVFAFLLIFQGQPVVEGRQFLNGLSPEYVLEVWALTMLGVFNWVVASGIPFNPFTHLWSLGVEQQFYLLWPPVLIILLRMNQMKVTLTVLLVAAGGSLFLGQWMPGVSQRHLLFGTDGAAYAILVGAIAALIWPKLKDVRIPPPFVLAAFAALAVHVFHPIPIEEVSRLLIASSAVILIMDLAAGSSLTSRIFALRLLTFIGDRSYALYVWHVPVLFWFSGLSAPLQVLAGFGLTLLMAEISMRLIERPARAWARNSKGREIWRPRLRRFHLANQE